ncbi:MAG: MoaD/ThiS family protein [Bacillota bacterium]|nr:MoaD/ThiS family protein [Bacillota bacterium]
MKIKVKFFGIASVYFGSDIKQMEIPEGSAIAELLEVIARDWENGAKDFLQRATFVVNQSRADRSTLLNNGDEVMIMFTMGGG